MATELLLDAEIDSRSLEALRSIPHVVVHQVEVSTKPVERPRELLNRVQILICKAPPANFDDLTTLEFLQLSTVGFEHLSHLRLGRRSIRACNARGIFDTAIAEWNIGMMIALTRDLRGMIRNQERGHWSRALQFQQETRGKTVGLWGYGGIGRETARLAKALGLTVHVLSRFGVATRFDDFTPSGTGDSHGLLPDRVFLKGHEREFLSGLDFLILALPRTSLTTGLIGDAELQALPRSAFVLNPARGPIIREDSLLRALQEGWIAGAALDTHYHYPMPAEHPLWQFPNVIMTPHISGADKSDSFPARFGALCVENVRRFQAGARLLNTVSREEFDES